MASTVLPNGIIIPEKFSRDWYADLYHNWQELDNLLGGGTPKDGTLTIQKNGSTVGTFSANQATNETVNIEVPTKTSDLNNDSGFITGVAWDDVTNKPSFATVATSGSYNDLSDKPAIPTVNNATLTIQKNGTDVATFSANSSTNATANITVPTKTSDLTNDSGFITEDTTKIPLAGSNQISGSLIPSTNGTVNLGGPSYQWNNAYIKSLTINGVACGDILTHNASEFVNVTSGQTIAGVKLFKDIIIRNVGNFTAGEAPTAQVNCAVLKHTNNDGTHSANTILSYMFNTGEAMCELTQIPCIGSTARTWFRTHTDGSYSIYSYTKNGSLGTSAYKWKDVQTEKINGINPGALSLPGSYVNVDTTNWVLDGTPNHFVPTSDGWFGIQCTDTVYDQTHYVFVGRTGGGSTYYQQNLALPVNALWDSKYHSCVFIPVVKGFNYDIRCICSSIIATFYPCQGNV